MTPARSTQASPPHIRLRAPVATPLALVVLVVVGTLQLTRTTASADTSSAPPTAGGYFTTKPPGVTLPSDAACASQVTRSTWEPRPLNAVADHTVPPSGSVAIPGYTANDGFDVRAAAYAARVTGNFTGTTDEVMQWAACKWGINDDVVRAMAVTESSWYQGLLDTSGRPTNGKGFGDFTYDQTKCQVGYSTPCPESFGLLEVKATSEPGTFPWSRDSTAFNVDYTLMVLRVCYEGWTNWLRYYPGGTTPYGGGDLWGCVGFWYSGNWYGSDGGASRYIDTVRGYYNQKPWLTWASTSPTTTTASVVSLNDSAVGNGTNQFEFIGTWWSWGEAGAYFGDTHGSWNNGDYYQVRFTGTQAALYAVTDAGGGTAGVSVDYGPESPVTFYSATHVDQHLIFNSPPLPAGPHILRVRNASSGDLVRADRVDVSA